MKKIFCLLFLMILSFGLVGCQQPTVADENKKVEVKLGIDLIEENTNIFLGKRVGLITNPTGVNSNYKSTIDVLYENDNVDLVALFAPEHGIRGNSQAGGTIGQEKDAITGLTVYSLYGNTKKPTAEMMENIDVLCIDIQDVGARFYTYIYTNRNNTYNYFYSLYV